MNCKRFYPRPIFRATLVLIALTMTSLQTEIAREYQIKAVFLYNFTQFTEWPDEAFSSPDSPLVIGVFGKDPFGSFLDETIQGEKVKGHPLVARRFTTFEEIGACHILFISDSEKNRVKEIIKNLKNKNILTVSDAGSFAKQGGMIRFVTENRKTRFRINLEAVKASNLTISSKLLRLAEIISEEK